MPFKVDTSKVEGQEVFPPGIYDFKLVGFKPKKASTGSINLNARFEMINHPDHAGKKVYDGLNEGAAFYWTDFCHALGLPMETDGQKDGNSWLPGEFYGYDANHKEDDITTWEYKGPLVGRVAKIEIAVGNYQGRDNNKIKRYFCALPDCAVKFPKIRHIEDLLKNQK
jgi:hypothetical protein